MVIAMLSMSLKTTVRLAIIGVVVGSIGIIGVTTGAYLMLDRIQARVAFANAVSANVGRLNLLTAELLLHESQRVSLQWRRQHEILLEQLAEVSLPRGQAAVLTTEMMRRLEALPPLVDEFEGPVIATRPANPQAAEAREIISESIIAQAGAILSQTIELREVLVTAAAAARRQVFLVIGGGFLAVMIGGGLALMLISNRLLSRILKLRTVIQQLGEGDLEADIPLWMRDEMGEVFTQLDQMRLSLLQSMGDLSRVNMQLVGAKAELEDRVAQRTAGLQEANRELEAFTYAVSHDLRGSLRRIAGFSQAVLEDHSKDLDGEGADMLRRVQGAATQMNQLVEDLLKLSKLNQKPIEVSEVDLSQIASEICDNLQDQTSPRKLAVKIAPGVTARCDARLMRIVLTNLIENAWKFSARKSDAVIEFGQRIEGGAVTFFIRDNGAGFDMAFSEKLFQPFQRLHSAKEFPGTGIGLATVARIIRLHGGKIWAESRPGEGATFFFQLGRPVDAGGREPAQQVTGEDRSASAQPARRRAAGAGKA